MSLQEVAIDSTSMLNQSPACCLRVAAQNRGYLAGNLEQDIWTFVLPWET